MYSHGRLFAARIGILPFFFLNCSSIFLKPHLHGRLFACDFLIKMDVAKLHLFNNVSHCDESYLTAENDCLKLFPFR